MNLNREGELRKLMNSKMAKIYLISPEKIDLKTFPTRLENVLKTGLVPAFQMRLKGYEESEVTKIARELKASEEGRNELRRLMEFSDPVVRALAAECSLGFDESRALAVLREVESSDNSYARSVASFNLVYWRTEHGLPMFEKPESPTGIPIGRRR